MVAFCRTDQLPEQAAKLQVLPDLSQYTLKQCKNLPTVMKALRNHKIAYNWKYPAKVISHLGSSTFISTGFLGSKHHRKLPIKPWDFHCPFYFPCKNVCKHQVGWFLSIPHFFFLYPQQVLQLVLLELLFFQLCFFSCSVCTLACSQLELTLPGHIISSVLFSTSREHHQDPSTESLPAASLWFCTQNFEVLRKLWYMQSPVLLHAQAITVRLSISSQYYASYGS